MKATIPIHEGEMPLLNGKEVDLVLKIPLNIDDPAVIFLDHGCEALLVFYDMKQNGWVIKQRYTDESSDVTTFLPVTRP